MAQSINFLSFFVVCVCVCVCLWERERERARARVAHKAKPRNFFSKYLSIESVDIAEMFGWFSPTVNLATHNCVAARHWLTASWVAAAVLLSVRTIYNTVYKWLKLTSVWPITWHPFLFLDHVWLTFWATYPPKSNPWRHRHGGG